MKQYDLVRLKGGEIAMILQSDLLDGLSTRIVVPVVPASEMEPIPRLQPNLTFGRRRMVLAMEQMTAIRLTDIDKVVASARGLEYEIQRAYDMVLSGI